MLIADAAIPGPGPAIAARRQHASPSGALHQGYAAPDPRPDWPRYAATPIAREHDEHFARPAPPNASCSIAWCLDRLVTVARYRHAR